MPVSKKKCPDGIRIIKKSNELIEARYRFEIWETRLFLSILAYIQKDDQDLEPFYRIWYKDVIKFFGLKSHKSYNSLREAVKSLMKKQFYVDYNENGFVREKAYQIIIDAGYLKDGQSGQDIENQEYIDIAIHQQMKPLLLQLVGNFTRYDLRNVTKLSANPVRLYELLKQYENIGNRVLEVDYVRRIMEFKDEYSRFSNFYQSFIKPGVKEINDYTDLTVYEVKKIKEGRNVVALHFFFKTKVEDELNKIRGKNQAIKQLPLFEIKPVEQEDAAPRELLTEFEEDFKKVNDWWGVEQDEFAKRVEGKTKKDIEETIEFTKSRIRIGKASNPAGVFLDALSKGHKSHEQHRGEKKVKQEQEKKERLQPLVEEYDRLTTEYNKEVNDRIRAITQEHPEETERVIEKLKAQFPAFQDKTIEDFRKNSTLRGMVKGEIMRKHPERFETLNSQEVLKIQEAKAKILAIEPGFKF